MANVWRFLSLLLLTIFELFVFGINGQNNCTVTQRCNDTVPNCFNQENIVDDLISESPNEQLQVTYGGIAVMMGDELKPSDVSSPPNVSFSSSSVPDNALYTLVMADPDAPSRANPTERSWRHWIVINSPYNNLQGGNVIATYANPQPPPNTCLHRYVFLVYRQDSTVPITNMPIVNDTNDRGKWDVNAWVQQYNLQKPIAGNYFMAQNSVGYISSFLLLTLIAIAFTTLPM